MPSSKLFGESTSPENLPLIYQIVDLLNPQRLDPPFCHEQHRETGETPVEAAKRLLGLWAAPNSGFELSIQVRVRKVEQSAWVQHGPG